MPSIPSYTATWRNQPKKDELLRQEKCEVEESKFRGNGVSGNYVTNLPKMREVCQGVIFTILGMRLSLAVNDCPVARASLVAKGWLGAHVSLSQDVESDEPA
jgi:hypothetical protein